MTTMTLKINDDREDLVEAFKVFISNVSGVTLEISKDNKQEVLSSISQACKDIKTKEGFKNSQSIEDFYKDLEND